MWVISRITHHALRIMPRPICFTNIIALNPDGSCGQTVRVQGNRVVDIDAPPQKNDQVIDGRDGLLIPGLINAHDHLELNTFKRLKYRDTYSHSLQWIEDIEARFEIDPDLVEPRQQPLADRLLIGAMKNLLSGVTTVCHHNPIHKPLRRNYPIRVVRNYGFCHSLFRGDEPGQSYRQANPNHPWIIHLAEGVDQAAAAEFDQLDALGAVGSNTVLVHGVGVTPSQRRALIERGAGLIWCPASNCFMFGQTAQVAEFAEAGKLALGSDSRLSGAFDLLQELHIARKSNQISAQALFKAVTTNAVQLLHLPDDGRGQIKIGGVADLVLLPPQTQSDHYAEISHLSRADLKLVMIAGKPLVGSPEMRPVFEATRTKFASVTVDGEGKLLAQKLATRLKESAVQEPGLIL